VQITREDLPDRQVALLIEFAPEEVEPALNKTYQRLSRKVNIPGFRPGKAPRAIFERYVGREALVQEASQGLLADAVKEALEREQLEGAEVDDASIESTDPLRVRVVFDRDPLVEVGDYEDIRVAAEPVNIGDSEVEHMIEHLRRRDAEWHAPAEARAAAFGDRVTVDLETFTIDGPVSNMTGVDQTFELSAETANTWPQDIDAGIVGMNIGDEKDLAIVFPDAYPDTDLRNKDATVHVKLKDIQEADLPELTDEFAGKVAPGVTSVDALRTRLGENLRGEQEQTAKGNQVRAALTALKERSTVDVPKAMINDEIQHRFEDLTQSLQQRRITPARYFSYNGSSEAEWREAQREAAREALKELLVLREFATREGITVSPDEIEAEIAERLAPYGEDENLEQLRGLIDNEQQRQQIANNLFERKLTDRLIAIAEGRGAEHRAEAGFTPAAPAAADESEAATAATSDDADSTPAVSGSVPATEQEPGPLETAGGAAEVLGNGDQVDHNG
jgi:trigger factor